MINEIIERVVSITILFLLSYLQPNAQNDVAILEGYIQAITPDGQLTLLITEVHNGAVPLGMIEAQLRESKWDRLYQGLRRFRSQKWLITLEQSTGELIYELTSAYGLAVDDEFTFDSLPIPIAVIPSEQGNENSRATFGNYEIELVELTNEERWDNGMLAPFKQVNLLHNSSDNHSEGMAIRHFFAHCDLDNHTSPGQRMQAAGYHASSTAENIAAGYGTPLQ
jgi:uncharacterized protein YkwD